MKDIIKADFYYYHKNVILFLTGVVLFAIYFGFGGLDINSHDYSGLDVSDSQLFQMVFIQNYIITLVAIIILTSVMQGKLQSNRFFMYQLLKVRAEGIIFSKYLVQYVYNLLFCIGAYGFATLNMCFVTHKNLFWAFFFNPHYLCVMLIDMLLLFSFTVRSVSIVLWVNSGACGALFNWIVTATAMLPTLLAEHMEKPFVIHIAKWTLPGQMYLLGRPEMLHDIIAKSIVTSVIGIALCWILTVCVVKKKSC